MWELDCEESWVLKNWCFWTVMLEKTLESPLDCKEIQPVHPKGDQSWCSLEGMMLKLKLQYFVKSWLIGKDSDAGRNWGQEEKGTTEDEMTGWHHWLDGRESQWTLGLGAGQGGLACCHSWGRKESNTTEWLDWTELNKHLVHTTEIVPSLRISALGKFPFLLPIRVWAPGSNLISHSDELWGREELLKTSQPYREVYMYPSKSYSGSRKQP